MRPPSQDSSHGARLSVGHPSEVDDDAAPGGAEAVLPVGRWPRLRLALLVVALVAAGAVFVVGDVVSVAEVRDAVERLGPAGPVLFVPVSALLGALLVPGPVLAGASGLMFGPLVGTLASVAAACLTSVLAMLGGRAAGRDGARAVLGPRRAAVSEGLLERHGLLAVVGQRLLPGVPDAPSSYAFGALGASLWQVLLGTLVGAAPRAFAYTAVGASLDDPTSPLAVSGLVVWVVVSVAGLELARRAWRGRRRARAGGSSQRPAA